MVIQIDIETAFLQAPLAEDIYMEIPNGYKDKFNKTAVLKLNKAIYGLRQSSKAFNDKLTWSLKQLGWSQLKSDPCIFKRGKEILAAFVDDCLVGAISEQSYSIILTEISMHLRIGDHGHINHFLKIEVEYNLKQLVNCLSQFSLTKL